MINFNLTLLVQVVHFFLVYEFLTKYLLKPALRVYLEEAEQDSYLERAIQEDRATILSMQDTIASGWNMCHRGFLHRRPVVKEAPTEVSFPYSSIKRYYEAEDLKQLTEEVVQKLKKKMIRE